MSLVMTVVGLDRPGLVESLAQTVAAHSGSWLESRMSRLEGRFAGILRASVPEGEATALTTALGALSSEGLVVVVEDSALQPGVEEFRSLRLELVGSDCRGIVRDISHTLAIRGINVDELETECRSAPMSGEALFSATALLRVPLSVSVSELQGDLERIANDLMVDISLERPTTG